MKVGIVGNGGIVKMALHMFREAGIQTPALWCRNAEKGKPLAEEFGCTLYTDYEAFLKDSSFDTVYIGLINSLHYAYSAKAMQAGKHCITEKPFTATYEEAEGLYRTAQENSVMLFEAIMSRYSTNYEEVRKHLPEIGNVKLVSGMYCQYSSRYDAYKEGKVLPAFDPALYGGALYDINIYNIHTVEGLFGMPEKVMYQANIGFNGVDTSGVLTLDYGSFKAVCTGAKDCAGPNRTLIMGDQGYIEIPGRPGHVKNAVLVKRDGTTVSLDAAEEPMPMLTEFEKIRDVVDHRQYDLAKIWLDRSMEVMRIVSEAEKSAGVHFGE